MNIGKNTYWKSEKYYDGLLTASFHGQFWKVLFSECGEYVSDFWRPRIIDYCDCTFLWLINAYHNLFSETSVSEIEEAFLQFTNRSDIAILLINQNVSVQLQKCFKIKRLYHA